MDCEHLQGFKKKKIGKKFIMKEVTVLRKGSILSQYIFICPMELLEKIRKVLRFLIEYLSPWIAMGRRDDLVSMVKRLITMALINADENVNNKVYVKEREKRK